MKRGKEEQDSPTWQKLLKIVKIILFAAGLCLIVWVTQGCRVIRDTQYIEMRDTMYISKVEWDSIYLRDSVFIKEKGDTVWRIEYHDRIKEKLKTDTVWQDKVKIVVDKKIVEKKVVPRWCWWMAGGSGLIIIAAIVLLIIKIYKKFHKI